MSRAARLLDLVQYLRRQRRPISGEALASHLDISLRTLYRDIATLQAQGAHIDGAPGLGYVLRDGFVLPPLMFTADEIEALALGSRWVGERGDPRLASAAQEAVAKISAVLPPEWRHALQDSAMLVGPPDAAPPERVDPALLRQAIRQQHKLDLAYRDAAGAASQRTVWPFALGFFDRSRVLIAWCERRQSIRHFRTDRIESATPRDERYPRHRLALLADWRAQEGIREP